jgi:HemY protein
VIRALGYLIVIFLIVAGAVWLLDRPGAVAVDWQGYRIETSFAVLVAGVAILAAAAALAYRFWLALVRAPGRIAAAMRERRRARGYRALTKGMVAVAAGDAGEAARQVKRAEGLLNEPPLTLLLSAQAAQLNGDDKAAERFFEEMTENPETEFLGLRGLLTQATKAGDDARALELARRAYRLQPKSDWVSASLFELQVRSGKWLDAQVTGDEQARLGLIGREANRRRKAVLALQQGAELARAGDSEEAAKRYKFAHDNAPEFVPAAVAWAGALIGQGKARRAADAIAKAWGLAPHPDLVEPAMRAAGAEDALGRVKAAERLAAANRVHPESLIALANAYLEAQLWGEARSQLGALGAAGGPDQARVCRLWADLEEAERNDTAAARDWLRRAALADADPAWVCDGCGNAVGTWSAICGNCGGFDSFQWRRPSHVTRLADTPAAVVSPSANLPAPVDQGRDVTVDDD